MKCSKLTIHVRGRSHMTMGWQHFKWRFFNSIYHKWSKQAPCRMKSFSLSPLPTSTICSDFHCSGTSFTDKMRTSCIGHRDFLWSVQAQINSPLGEKCIKTFSQQTIPVQGPLSFMLLSFYFCCYTALSQNATLFSGKQPICYSSKYLKIKNIKLTTKHIPLLFKTAE